MSDCDCPSENVEVTRGTTLSLTWRPMSLPIVYKTITDVVTLTPLTLTVPTHGVIDGWSIALADAGGLDKFNAKKWPPGHDDLYDAIVVDSNTIQLNEVDAARCGQTYTGGGKIGYYSPLDLSTGTAQLSLYDYPRVAGAAAVLQVSATLSDVAKTIVTEVSAVQSATLTKPNYAYALTLTQNTHVTQIQQGVFQMSDLGTPP